MAGSRMRLRMAATRSSVSRRAWSPAGTLSTQQQKAASTVASVSACTLPSASTQSCGAVQVGQAEMGSMRAAWQALPGCAPGGADRAQRASNKL